MFDDATHPTYPVVRDFGPWEAIGNNKDIVAAQVPVDNPVSMEKYKGECDIVK